MISLALDCTTAEAAAKRDERRRRECSGEWRERLREASDGSGGTDGGRPDTHIDTAIDALKH